MAASTAKHSGKFLSTPSARRATGIIQRQSCFQIISIHALREEGDGFTQELVCEELNFYPRPPRGGRPAMEARSHSR